MYKSFTSKSQSTPASNLGIASIYTVALVATKWVGKIILAGMLGMVAVSLIAPAQLTQVKELIYFCIAGFVLFAIAVFAVCAYVNLTKARLGKPDVDMPMGAPSTSPTNSFPTAGLKGDFAGFPTSIAQ